MRLPTSEDVALGQPGSLFIIDDHPLRLTSNPSQRSPSWRTELQADTSQAQVVFSCHGSAGACSFHCMVRDEAIAGRITVLTGLQDAIS
jgi:hypothetical protein